MQFFATLSFRFLAKPPPASPKATETALEARTQWAYLVLAQLGLQNLRKRKLQWYQYRYTNCAAFCKKRLNYGCLSELRKVNLCRLLTWTSFKKFCHQKEEFYCDLRSKRWNTFMALAQRNGSHKSLYLLYPTPLLNLPLPQCKRNITLAYPRKGRGLNHTLE